MRRLGGVEPEDLPVCRKQQGDAVRPEDERRRLVDRDPRAARMEQHQLDVMLPARPEPPAGWVYDRARADAHRPQTIAQ